MKKILSLFSLLLALSTLQLQAQESVGFSDSTDFKYLIDYRLPDWGYSNFSISSGTFGLSGANQDLRSQREEPGDPSYRLSNRDASTGSFNLGVTPRFELYQESEDRIIDFDSFVSLGTSGLKRTIEDEDTFNNQINNSKQEDIANQTGISKQISFRIKEYSDFSTDLFFTAGLNSNINYSRSSTERNDVPGTNSESISKTRDLRLTPSFGVGFGRLRNVTPMLRALRVNERYKSLGNSSFSNQEIINTAETFTKVQGYQRTKDRFLKSFWGDINSGVNDRLDQLEAFDLFYLNDVFSENLGQRFEGYSFSISGEYSYANNLRRIENKNGQTTNETRDFFIQRFASVNVDGDWYKNLNLYHQINISFVSRTIFPLERDIREEWANFTNLSLSWQWNFADRFQFNSSLDNSLFTEEIKDSRDDDFVRFISQLSGQLSYFIENRMSLSAGLSLEHRRLDRTISDVNVDQDQNEFFWSVNASVRYFFNRNLY